MFLIDTDVVVDVLRSYPRAVTWMRALIDDDAEPSIVGYSALELLDGCTSRLEVRRVQTFLQACKVWWPTNTDRDRAIETFAITHLTHGIGFIDVLIAECAKGLDATLQTFNIRHFASVPDLRIAQPYVR